MNFIDRFAMPKLSRTWISIICFSLSSFVFGQELPFTHYTQDHEVVALPSADVRTVYQDRAGYVWFVVYSSGLLSYNGHKTDIYTKEDGLPDLTVWHVLEDHLGRLWVATNLGLAVSRKPLNQYTGDQRIDFSAKIGATQLVKTTIVQNRLAVDSLGILWIGTREDGIIRYRFNGLDSVRADTIRTSIHGEENNKDIRSIALRRDGSVWVGVGGGDLLVFSTASTNYDILTENDGVPRFETDALYENRSGRLWGGCRNGLLWSMAEETDQRRVEVFSEELKNRITCINGTGDGKLWVASEGSGIMCIADGNLQAPQSSSSLRHVIFTQRNGLLGDNVNYTIEDREGNIWFAQSGGVSKLRSNYAAFANFSPSSRLGEKPALPNPSLNAVLPPADGRTSSGIWVGTSGAGAALIADEGNVELIQTDRGLRENWVNGLVRDGKGRIWMGTADGINCLSFDSQNPPPPSPEVRGISVLNRKGVIAAYEHHTIYACQMLPFPAENDKMKSVESLWFPGYQHLYCFTENEWFIFRTASGLPATLFHTVAFDEAGRLLVGTRDRGLFRSRIPLTRTRLRQLQANDVDFPAGKGGGKFGREISTSIFEPVWNQSTGAPSNQIETLHRRDGSLWVGTTEGLSVLEGEPPRMTTHLTVEQGLKARNVTSMAFSPASGTLWAGTNGGLAEIDPQTRKVIRTVTKQDGLVDNEVWFYGSVVIGAEGTVYFGTAKGLAIYRPLLDKPNTVFPILRMERADFTEDLSGDNEIAFEYAALSFANEKLVRYKTRLVGYDKAWTDERSEFKIRYTNLPAFLFPREYTFEVLASNNAGLWTETPLRHSFTVQPPWWFRWWWFAFNAALLLAVVYGFSRYRLRRLQMRSRILERTVRERTEEIRQQAEELETLDGIVKVINREVALESVLRSLLEQGLKLFPQAEKASVLLFDHQIGRFKFAVAAGYDPHMLKDVSFAPEELTSRYSQGSEEVGSGVYIVRDLQQRYVERKLNLASMPKSVLAMTAGKESMLEAYLIFDNLTNAEAFDHSDAQKLSRFREHAISAIAKAKMLQELQEKNAEIIKTQNQLIMQEKLASLGALTAGIAHEIRNP
jgi:ligand-binding sensor domain-containing protein